MSLGSNLRVFFSWHNCLVTVSAKALHWKSTDSLRGLKCSLPVQRLLDHSSSYQSSAVGTSCALRDLWLYQSCCFQHAQSTVSVSLEGKFCCLLSSYSSVVSVEGNGQNTAPGLKGLLCALAGDTDTYLFEIWKCKPPDTG